MKEKIKIFSVFILLIIGGFLILKNNTVEAYGECSKYGSMAYYDSITNTCKCFSGYVFGKSILGDTYCISKDQWCRDKYGFNAMSDYLGGCKCMSGYVFGKDIFGNTSCVSADQLCKDQYGVMARYNSLYDKCECFIGYVFGEDILGGTQCISEDEWCQDKYGFNSKYNTLKDKCECKSGYELTLKSTGGLECVSCFSKYGLHSSYDYLSNKCECDDGYTLDTNNQCVEKQNNVYFLLEELDLNNRKAIVKSDYDYREYLIEYGYGCYDSTIERYLNKKIVINLGTDFNLDMWDKIVLQNDSITCDITNVERVFGASDICDSGYILEDNRCSKINCPLNSTTVANQCLCNQGYVASGNICVTYSQNCQNKYGVNSYGDKSYCYCNAGYEMNSNKTACIKSVICPLNSTKVNNICVCNEGFVFKNGQCITYTQDCQLIFGDYVIGRKGDAGNSFCDCETGHVWNSSQTACIKTETPEKKEEIIKLTQEEQIQQNQQEEQGYQEQQNKEEQKEEPKGMLEVEKQISNEVQKQGQESQEQRQEQEQKQKEGVSTFLANIFTTVKNFFYRLFSWF